VEDWEAVDLAPVDLGPVDLIRVDWDFPADWGGHLLAAGLAFRRE
jgi:hypothetical protein